MTNDERQQRRERMARGATDFAESVVAYFLGEVQHALLAPSPAPQAGGPRWKHDEPGDLFLGRREMADMYWGLHAMYIKISDSTGVYIHPGHELYPALDEARRRAIAARLIAEPAKPAESPAEDPAWRAGEIEKAAAAAWEKRYGAGRFRNCETERRSEVLAQMETALIAINHIRPRPAPPHPAPVPAVMPDVVKWYPYAREPQAVPAVIETPEEVAERVLEYIAVPLNEEDRDDATAYVVLAIRERDAAHAAQLAQAREAALEEAATLVGKCGSFYNFEAAIRALKARPVAAGGM